MSSSSNQRRREDREAEASVSGRQGVELPQESALRLVTIAQVATSQYGDVEPLLLKGPSPSLLSPPLANVAGVRKKEKKVDFDASAEHLVQTGRPSHSDVLCQAVLPSSSRGLGPVANEYFELAPTLYEEFLTGGLR
ncbi:hypothetical protein ACOSP7_016811 [Xanthoceras sorbifolium]